MPNCVALSTNRKTKGERRLRGPWVIIGRFGGKYDLVHFRGSYLEVDLDDMRPANRLLEVLKCDGAFRLHLPSTKFTNTLFGVPPEANFPFANGKCDFGP